MVSTPQPRTAQRKKNKNQIPEHNLPYHQQMAVGLFAQQTLVISGFADSSAGFRVTHGVVCTRNTDLHFCGVQVFEHWSSIGKAL